MPFEFGEHHRPCSDIRNRGSPRSRVVGCRPRAEGGHGARRGPGTQTDNTPSSYCLMSLTDIAIPRRGQNDDEAHDDDPVRGGGGVEPCRTRTGQMACSVHAALTEPSSRPLNPP